MDEFILIADEDILPHGVVGLNEVQIMAAHWMFAIPLSTAFLLKRFETGALGRALTLLVQCLAVGTACYNVALMVSYFI